jgi:penicillin-binding protein 1A
MLKRIALYACICLFLNALGLVGIYYAFNDHLPDLDELESFQPKRITKLYSADGEHLKDFLEENREILTYAEIPQGMKDALLAIEDRRFFSHWGMDIHRIFGAFINNIMSLDLTAQGASTLTQQLARNQFAKIGWQRGNDTLDELVASFSRKIREQITAVNIERIYTKQEILTQYLNTVFFGNGRHGLKAAARFYFDKEAQELQPEECALLAGLLKAPTTYNPLRNYDRALKRRNTVLQAMASAKKISPDKAARLQRKPIEIRRGKRAESYGKAPYFVEHIRQQLERQFGSRLKRDGFAIHTTLDARLQLIAEKHFAAEIGKVQQAVDKYLARQDSAAGLPDTATVQAAFVAIDPQTGYILAMIGGRDFTDSPFNRATQATRQPGSAFKPFTYTAAIDNGRFPIDVLDDNAITVTETNGEIWDPENYDKTFKGSMTLREGFKQSRNLIAIKLAQDVGPRRIAHYAKTMLGDKYYVQGERTRSEIPIAPVTSIAIGTSGVHLMDLVAAYSVFPNKGIYVEPIGLKRVADKDGNTVFEQKTNRREVLRPAVAVIMTDMMRSVIDEARGTGRKIRYHYGFKTQAGGKTGTTNSYADAWFIGFTPHIVAGVWVGMDDPSMSLWPRQAGAVAALPLWALFMQEVYRDVEPYRSRADEEFDYPVDLVVERAICKDTHKLATRYCPRQGEDIFIREGVMPEFCPLHGAARTGKPAKRRQRF